MTELCSDNLEEVTVGLLASGQDGLDQTDGTLKPIEDSSYDPCENCGMKIFDYCSSAHCECLDKKR
jgi:hypothetical protein